MDQIRNEYIRGTAQVEHFGKIVTEPKLWRFWYVQRNDSGFIRVFRQRKKRKATEMIDGCRQRGHRERIDTKRKNGGIEWERGRWTTVVTTKGTSQKKEKKTKKQILYYVCAIFCSAPESTNSPTASTCPYFIFQGFGGVGVCWREQTFKGAPSWNFLALHFISNSYTGMTTTSILLSLIPLVYCRSKLGLK